MTFNARGMISMFNRFEMYGYSYAGDNLLTTRPIALYQNLTAIQPSENSVEAGMKVRRLYKRICRLMPGILRWHYMNGVITPYEACTNAALNFRFNRHLRDPKAIDKQVQDGYEMLHDLQFLITDIEHLRKVILPQNYRPEKYGYSVLDDKKNQGRSDFLKKFYSKNLTNLY